MTSRFALGRLTGLGHARGLPEDVHRERRGGLGQQLHREARDALVEAQDLRAVQRHLNA